MELRPECGGVSITRDDWLRAVAEIGELEDDQEALSIQEYADLMGTDYINATRQLNRLAKAGKAEKTRKNGRSPVDGRAVRFVAYRLVR